MIRHLGLIAVLSLSTLAGVALPAQAQTTIGADAPEPGLAPGAQVGAAYATPDGASAAYWAGFQRRWAMGLELNHRTPSP